MHVKSSKIKIVNETTEYKVNALVTTRRLTPDSVRRIIKKWADQARIPKVHYSGHSLRVGSAVLLAQAGATSPEMQQVDRWKSKDMRAYYAPGIKAENDAIARYKYGKGKS